MRLAEHMVSPRTISLALLAALIPASLTLGLDAYPNPTKEPAAPGRELSASEAASFLERWAQRVRDIRSLAIRFRQEKRLKILRRPRISHGDLVYADGKLSVVVKSKDGVIESQLLLRDGELKILYPRLKRLEVIELGKAGAPGEGGGRSGSGSGSGKAPGIPFFAGDPRDLEKDFVVKVFEDAANSKQKSVRLTPKEAASPLRELELVFVDLEMRQYRQVEKSGDEARMEITSAELNPKVDPHRFDLEVPAGTVTVHPMGEVTK